MEYGDARDGPMVVTQLQRCRRSFGTLLYEAEFELRYCLSPNLKRGLRLRRDSEFETECGPTAPMAPVFQVFRVAKVLESMHSMHRIRSMHSLPAHAQHAWRAV